MPARRPFARRARVKAQSTVLERIARRGAFAAAGLALLAPLAGAAQAQDGSLADNPGLRQGYEACFAASCDAWPAELPSKTPEAPARAVSLVGDAPAPAPRPPAIGDPGFGYPAGVAPHATPEPYSPPLAVDWSLSLRGAYVQDKDGKHFEVLLVPRAGFTYERDRTAIAFDADAEIVRPSADQLRIAALRLALAADQGFDRYTSLSVDGEVSLSQDSPSDPELPSGVSEAPLALEGTLEAGLTRKFGRLAVTLRGNLERDLYGETRFADGTAGNNQFRNRTFGGGGLRVAYGLTPIIGLFAEGRAGYEAYDAAAPGLGLWLNGPVYAAEAGVTGQWGERLTAEASAGLGLRRFDEASLAEIAAVLYNAQITYRPSASLTLGGRFATGFAPVGSGGGTAQVEYTAAADASYKVNSWLVLRALASWSLAVPSGAASERTYGFGVGADYLLGPHTSLALDYGFSRREAAPDPTADTHRVTVGLTVAH